MPVWQGNIKPGTMPGQFIDFWLGNQRIGAGMGAEFDETFSGSWEQPFGQDDLARQPGMRSGRGHVNRFRIWMKDLRSALAAQTDLLNASANLNNLDLRFIELTASTHYDDGAGSAQYPQRTELHTLHRVYITDLGRRVEDGTRNQREDITFDYAYETVGA